MSEKGPEGKLGETEEKGVSSDKLEQKVTHYGEGKVVGGYLTDNLCTICGARLCYYPPTTGVKCYFCGKEEKARIRCMKGHYICSVCWPKHGNYVRVHGDKAEVISKGKVICSMRRRKS